MKRIAPRIAMALLFAAALASLALDPGPPPGQADRAGPGAVLLTLDLQGPSSVDENSLQRYTLLARYDDGTSVDVTDRAVWQVDSPRARVTRGALTVAEVQGDRTATLSAWFTDGLSLKAARTVTLADRGEGPGPAGFFSARDRALPAGERAGGRGT